MAQEPLSITNMDSYLLVEFHGEFSVESGKHCVDRMAEACDKHQLSKVLLDCRNIKGKMPVFDRFQVAEYGASKRRQIGRFALLNREDVLLPDNFVENVAVNRGMQMKIFTDFEQAERWLTKSGSAKPDTNNHD